MVDDREFAIKPMNCPGSLLVFKNALHSYKDLPLRMGELGQVHRHEASGALNGLFRVRTFTQDDAHIFMRPDQIESEVMELIKFIDRVYSVFGLSYRIELSTRPEKKYIGDLAIWEKSEKALADACVHAGKEYKVNPGDGAFYGPKLDFHIKDSLGREWQCGTIQLDMNLPERFDLSYVESDGSKARPVMLHRVIFGSIERFIGILIEHFAGHFPTWLAPTQVMVVPVHYEKHVDFASEINEKLNALGFRSKLDARNEKLGYRIREAQMQKVPYQLVIGDGEIENRSVTIRKAMSKESITMPLDEFITMLSEGETFMKLFKGALAAVLALTLTACSTAKQEEPIKVLTPMGAPSLSLLGLYGNDKVTMETVDGADTLAAELSKEDGSFDE
jgi:threonyl-tRNA synthetase